MDPNVSKVCDKVREFLGSGRKQSCTAVYMAGAQLLFVHDQYGTKQVAAIAKELGYAYTTLTFYIEMARAWSPAEFAVKVKDVNKKGMPMSPTHFRILAGVHDAAQREALRKKCLSKSWNCRELQTEIYPNMGGGLSDLTRKKLKMLSKSAGSMTWLDTLFAAMKDKATLNEVVTYCLEVQKT